MFWKKKARLVFSCSAVAPFLNPRCCVLVSPVITLTLFLVWAAVNHLRAVSPDVKLARTALRDCVPAQFCLTAPVRPGPAQPPTWWTDFSDAVGPLTPLLNELTDAKATSRSPNIEFDVFTGAKVCGCCVYGCQNWYSSSAGVQQDTTVKQTVRKQQNSCLCNQTHSTK